MIRILVTGANGFLGQHLCRFLLENKTYEVIATGRGENRVAIESLLYEPADFTKEPEVRGLLERVQPDVIVHTAAMSKPDECHQNREACLAANVTATSYLLGSGVSHFIYTSTDFVFGEDGPHAEDAPTRPLNFYGDSKLMAEKLVASKAKTYTIVRPVFIYGKKWDDMRGSFVHWVQSNLSQGKKIKVVEDQSRTPTYAPDICKGITTIIERKATGIYHLAGGEVLSPYEMAVATAKALNLDETLIEPVTADTFPETVKRARRSGLLIQKAVRELNYQPVSFQEGLALTFEL